MSELDWALKNWCFQTVVLEKALESPLDWKESQPVKPKGNQSWIFMEGLVLKLKLQYCGYLMQRADSLEKTLMLGKIEGRGRREMVGWQHWLNVHEFEQTLGDSEGRGNRSCVLQYMRSQRVRHDLVTEQQQCLLMRSVGQELWNPCHLYTVCIYVRQHRLWNGSWPFQIVIAVLELVIC